MELYYNRVLFILSVITLNTVNGQSRQGQYRIPQPTVTALSPRGFRVSIPDERGIVLFAFHGSINKELRENQEGDYHGDTRTRSSNGLWEYENNRYKLQRGDVLYFWLYVQHNSFGYKLENQRYVFPSYSMINNNFDDTPNYGPNNDETNNYGITSIDDTYNTGNSQWNQEYTTPRTTTTTSSSILIFEDMFTQNQYQTTKRTVRPQTRPTRATTSTTHRTSGITIIDMQNYWPVTTQRPPQQQQQQQQQHNQQSQQGFNQQRPQQGTTQQRPQQTSSTQHRPQQSSTSQQQRPTQRPSRPAQTTAESIYDYSNTDNYNHQTQTGNFQQTSSQPSQFGGNSQSSHVNPQTQQFGGNSQQHGTQFGSNTQTQHGGNSQSHSPVMPLTFGDNTLNQGGSQSSQFGGNSQTQHGGSSSQQPSQFGTNTQQHQFNQQDNQYQPQTSQFGGNSQTQFGGQQGTQFGQQDNNRPNLNCNPSITTVNKKRINCKDTLLFEEQFDYNFLDRWSQDVRMPLEFEDAEFVVYENYPSVWNVSHGNLNIYPKLLYRVPESGFSEQDIRTGRFVIDPRDCTSIVDPNQECERQAGLKRVLPPVVSAKFRSKKSFSFKFGRVEIRAKVPKGDWLFPQIYLEPSENKYRGTGDLPYLNGQVRIAFVRGNEYLEKPDGIPLDGKILTGICVIAGGDTIRETARKSIHYGQEHFGNEFHTYSLIWTNTSIKFAVDDLEYGTDTGGYKNLPIQYATYWQSGTNMAPFDQEAHVSLGVGVGGNADFTDDLRTGWQKLQKPWENTSPKAELSFYLHADDWHSTWNSRDSGLVVDYVKVYSI